MPLDQSGHWVPPDTVHPLELYIPHPEGYTYSDPIPEATTLTPEELLEKFYSDRAKVRDWTDPNGILRLQQAIHRDFPQYAARPVGSSGLVARWPRPGNLGAVPVDVYQLSSAPRAREVIIEFKNRNQGSPSTGISVRDLLGGSPEALEGAGDIVLDKIRPKKVMLSIAWVGYSLELSIIHTRRETDGTPYTRFELGQQIAVAYGRFFKRVEEEFVLPLQAGFFNIALHQGQNSRQDSLGIQLLQLHLVRFRKVKCGFWAADMEIV